MFNSIFHFLKVFYSWEKKYFPRKTEREENDQGSLFTNVQQTHQHSFGHLNKMDFLEKTHTNKTKQTFLSLATGKSWNLALH